jgi:hypothetical protein
MPKEVLELPHDSAIGVVNADEASGCLLVHKGMNLKRLEILPRFEN